MRQASLITIIASVGIACPALALPFGAIWIEIPIVDSPDDPVDLTGYRSFDLYVFVEPGDQVFQADTGFFEDFPLTCTEPIFEHPFGSNVEPHPILEDLFPDIVYDTFLAIGNLDGANGEIQVNFEFNTDDPMPLQTIWNQQPPGTSGSGPGGGVFPEGHFFQLNALNRRAVWLGRFTVDFLGDYEQSSAALIETIEGDMVVSGHGPNGGFGPLGDSQVSGRFYAPSPFGLSGPVMFLDPFAMLRPLDGDPAVDPNNVVLEWEEVVPPVVPPQEHDPHYHVRVTTDYRHWNNIIAINHLTEESYTIPSGLLEPCTTYYWHVFGDNAYDRGPASNWRDGAFTTTFTGDLNKDGTVDAADLGQLITDFSTSEAASDINGDGLVDAADLGQLIANFGLSCD